MLTHKDTSMLLCICVLPNNSSRPLEDNSRALRSRVSFGRFSPIISVVPFTVMTVAWGMISTTPGSSAAGKLFLRVCCRCLPKWRLNEDEYLEVDVSHTRIVSHVPAIRWETDDDGTLSDWFSSEKPCIHFPFAS
jgi:hypothetical protein